MLSRPDLHDIIRWVPQGDSFQILDPIGLEDHVLPIYFNHSSLASFKRQLSSYEFKKKLIGDSSDQRYFHEYFIRDRADLLPLIKRKQSVPKLELSSESEPIPEAFAQVPSIVVQMMQFMAKEIQQLKETVGELSKRVVGLENDKNALFQELQNGLKAAYYSNEKADRVSKKVDKLVSDLSRRASVDLEPRDLVVANQSLDSSMLPPLFPSENPSFEFSSASFDLPHPLESKNLFHAPMEISPPSPQFDDVLQFVQNDFEMEGKSPASDGVLSHFNSGFVPAPRISHSDRGTRLILSPEPSVSKGTVSSPFEGVSEYRGSRISAIHVTEGADLQQKKAHEVVQQFIAQLSEAYGSMGIQSLLPDSYSGFGCWFTNLQSFPGQNPATPSNPWGVLLFGVSEN